MKKAPKRAKKSSTRVRTKSRPAKLSKEHVENLLVNLRKIFRVKSK